MRITYMEPTDDWYHWFAGFFAGEGCFGTGLWGNGPCQVGQIFVNITLSRKDRPILVEIQRRLGVGAIFDDMRKRPSTGEFTCPMSRWRCIKLPELFHVIVPLFDKYPMRNVKWYDYPLWRNLVMIRWEARGAGKGKIPQVVADKFNAGVEQLRENRKLLYDSSAL